jgi:nucleoside-diphosphate-sugar epimerase
VASNTAGLPRVLDAFAARGGRVVLVTGSVFEGHEGAGEPPRLAVSPYGLSKQLSGAACEFWCHRAGLGFGKFVIPNPFGPFEEPRLTAYLVREWRAGRVPVIATPDYVRDNIHVDLLARCYAGHLGALLAGRGAPRMAPSGYVERQGDFARRFAAEMRARVGWAGDVELAEQTVFEEPRMRVNTEPAVALVPEWREREAWDGIADYYSRQEALG